MISLSGTRSAVVIWRFDQAAASARPGIGGTSAALPGARTTARSADQHLVADPDAPLALEPRRPPRTA